MGGSRLKIVFDTTLAYSAYVPHSLSRVKSQYYNVITFNTSLKNPLSSTSYKWKLVFNKNPSKKLNELPGESTPRQEMQMQVPNYNNSSTEAWPYTLAEKKLKQW